MTNIDKFLFIALVVVALFFSVSTEDWVLVGKGVYQDLESAHREGTIGHIRMREGEGDPVFVAFDCVRLEKLDRNVPEDSPKAFLDGINEACHPNPSFWKFWRAYVR